MGLFKRAQRRPVSERPVRQSTQSHAGDPVKPGLPGSAGYRGTAPLPKNCMPQSRFNYVRPDGKPDR